jgi:hypothetical protein
MMEFKLEPDTIDALMKKYNLFHDSLIQQINLQRFHGKTRSVYKLEIALSVQEWEGKSPGNWVNLIFQVDDVSTLDIEMAPEHIFAIAFALRIGFKDDQVCLDFLENTDDPIDFGQAYSRSETETKLLVVVGKQCSIKQMPYKQWDVDE